MEEQEAHGGRRLSAVGGGSYRDPESMSAVLTNLLTEMKEKTVTFTHAHGLKDGTYKKLTDFHKANPFQPNNTAAFLFAYSQKGDTESILNVNVWHHQDVNQTSKWLFFQYPAPPNDLMFNSTSVFSAQMGANSQYDQNTLIKLQIRAACGDFGEEFSNGLCGAYGLDTSLPCADKSAYISNTMRPTTYGSRSTNIVLSHVTDVNIEALNRVKTEYYNKPIV